MSHEPSAGAQAGELARALALDQLRRRGGRPWRAVRSFLALTPGRASGPRGAASPNRRILCTDREPWAADSLVCALRLAGFDARGCSDSAAALVEVTDFRPHACVLDLDTPGLGGYELARWARATIGGRVLLIAVTDRAGAGVEGRAAGAGFDLVFDRPADPVLVIGLAAGPGLAPAV